MIEKPSPIRAGWKVVALSAAAYVFIVFPLAIIWHLVLFKSTYDNLGYIGREEPGFLLGFASIAIQGVLLALFFPFIYRNGGRLASGIKFGLFLGAYHWTIHVVAAAAKAPIEPVGLFFLLESSYLTLQFGLAGIAIAFIQLRKQG